MSTLAGHMGQLMHAPRNGDRLAQAAPLQWQKKVCDTDGQCAAPSWPMRRLCHAGHLVSLTLSVCAGHGEDAQRHQQQDWHRVNRHSVYLARMSCLAAALQSKQPCRGLVAGRRRWVTLHINKTSTACMATTAGHKGSIKGKVQLRLCCTPYSRTGGTELCSADGCVRCAKIRLLAVGCMESLRMKMCECSLCNKGQLLRKLQMHWEAHVKLHECLKLRRVGRA